MNKNNRIKLTIGVPVYNAKSTIDRCLKSLVNLNGFSEFEVICIDDGSTDESAEILKGYSEKYPNITVVLSKNKGAFITRSTLIDKANGNWIGFVDADDTVEPDMFNEMLIKAQDFPASDIVVCAFNKISSNRRISVQMASFGDINISFKEKPELRSILIGVNPAYWNKIYRLDTLKHRLKLDYSPKIMEDCLFFASILPNVNGISFISRPLYNYFLNGKSISKKICYEDLKKAESGILDLIKNKHFSDGAQNDILAAIMTIHLGIAFTINWNNDFKISDVWRETISFLDKNFKGWRSNYFLKKKFLYLYAIHFPTMSKLWVAFRLYKYAFWPYIVKMYHLVCLLIGKDFKW